MRIPHWREPIGRHERPDIFNWGWGPALGAIAGFGITIYVSIHVYGIDDLDWRFIPVWIAYWAPVLAVGWKHLYRDEDR